MFTKTVHHVAINVSDIKQAHDFYVNKLGFTILAEHVRPEKNDVKLDLALNGMQLEIFEKKDAPERLNYPEALGLRHLAFYTDDIFKSVDELAALGITCEPVRVDEFTNKHMTFFFDPDGLPLELHE